MEIEQLAAALSDIERTPHDFMDLPDADASGAHLLETLRRCSGTLNEPYGFDSGTDALRLRIWRDCVTIQSNLELAAPAGQEQSRELIKTQLRKLSTLIEGMLDLLGGMADRR